MASPTFNFRIDPQLLADLKLVSDSQGISPSAYVVQAIQYCMSEGVVFAEKQHPPQSTPIDVLGSVRELLGGIYDRLSQLEQSSKAYEERFRVIESFISGTVAQDVVQATPDNLASLDDPAAVAYIRENMATMTSVQIAENLKAMKIKLVHPTGAKRQATYTMVNQLAERHGMVNPRKKK